MVTDSKMSRRDPQSRLQGYNSPLADLAQISECVMWKKILIVVGAWAVSVLVYVEFFKAR
jgi:hypothetical protein